jgi:hypothetical protein
MKMLIIGLSLLVTTSFVNHPKPTNKLVDGYDVQLVSTTFVNNNFEWVWKVTNLNPGNGRDGTLQDMSHWSLILSSCVAQANIVGAAYSADGLSWSSLPAILAVDPSQSCYTQPVLKFNQGLNDIEPTYYKLIVNKAFSTGYAPAVFKSGKSLPCYIGMVEGIVCPDETPSR